MAPKTELPTASTYWKHKCHTRAVKQSLMKETLEMRFDAGGGAHLVRWNFLGCARRTHNKTNICHEFVIEHQSIPKENKTQHKISFMDP